MPVFRTVVGVGERVGFEKVRVEPLKLPNPPINEVPVAPKTEVFTADDPIEVRVVGVVLTTAARTGFVLAVVFEAAARLLMTGAVARTAAPVEVVLVGMASLPTELMCVARTDFVAAAVDAWTVVGLATLAPRWR